MKQLKNKRNDRMRDAALAEEPLFRRLLSLERRRCERSGGRFALLLIEMEALRDSVSSPVIENIAVAVAGAMRETDITGWYDSGSAVGVILTTLNETEKQTIESVILERTRALVALHLDAGQLKRVRISCHLFPEDDVSNHIFYSIISKPSLHRASPFL